MIAGTGPDRGVPWWRWRRPLSLRWAPSDLGGRPVMGVSRPEPPGKTREGRTVAVIKGSRR
jgi:hypothetical protein